MTDGTKKYSGGCHCGRVRFDATADLAQVADCNCSICSRRGWLLAFVPAEQFELRSGGDALTDYQFGPKRIHHLFCSVCGTSSFTHGTMGGKTMYSINVRCLDDFDTSASTVSHYDGRSLA